MGRVILRPFTLSLVLAAGLLAAGCSNTLSQAQLAYDNGDYATAEDLYKQTIQEGDEVDAEIAKEELFEMHMQQAKELKGKGKQQEEHYRKALTLDPSSGEAREGLAQALVALYRHDEALQIVQDGLGSGTCKGCERMYAVMLIQRADNQAASENWAGAEADYRAACEYLPDPAVELSLARAQLAQAKVDEASETLRKTAPMISVDSAGLRQLFLELRRAVVLALLAEDKAAAADELLDVAPQGVSGEEQLGLSIEVAMEFSRLGQPAEALSRMQALVGAADAGRLRISDARKAELRDRVADLLAARAALSLANGDLSGARVDIDDALKLRPTNSRAQLQNVLLLAAEGKVSAAKVKLGKVDKKVVGRSQVDAILRAAEVKNLVAAGRVADARRELDAAKAIDADVPEIHVAEAEILAQTPVEGLSKAQSKSLQSGLIKYPAEPTRVGEALSEIAWARKAISGQGDKYPYRGANTIKRMQELEDALRKYYPFVVEFQSKPVAVLVISDKGGAAASVKVEGSGVSSTVEAPANGSGEIEVGSPGPVTLTAGGAAKLFLAEPYTKVHLTL